VATRLALILLIAQSANADILTPGAIAQPQAQWVDDRDNARVSNPQESGFALKHARGYVTARYQTRSLLWEARIEAEFVPSFVLLDAYAAVGGELVRGGFWKVIAGQHFAPFSRQTILSIGDLQFSQMAQLTSLTPGRQLGFTAMLAVPAAPWLQLAFGVYNGKGINVIENLDSNFMYVGRLAFRPIATRAPLMEGALGPNAVWVAVDAAYNKQTLGGYDQFQVSTGADAFLSIKGFSFYGEYFWSQTSYSQGAPKLQYNSQGVNVQAGYLLPIPGVLYRRFELAGRIEAVAPNRTVPITGPGDPTQGRAAYVGSINYYHRGHNLKLLLSYTYNQELDDKTLDGRSAKYHNDQIVLQLNYRLE
jgi:hypothetical protein